MLNPKSFRAIIQSYPGLQSIDYQIYKSMSIFFLTQKKNIILKIFGFGLIFFFLKLVVNISSSSLMIMALSLLLIQ